MRATRSDGYAGCSYGGQAWLGTGCCRVLPLVWSANFNNLLLLFFLRYALLRSSS